jgi:glyoxylate carboligase
MKMTTEEAFIKVLQMHGIEHAFGIIGSAMMPISDLFPRAGISFWDCGHECNAGMMADGFTRASGKMSMMVALSKIPCYWLSAWMHLFAAVISTTMPSPEAIGSIQEPWAIMAQEPVWN